jgi:chromosome segregation ATPase
MDTLHGELSDWQRDLTRQQALLDQREAAFKDGIQSSENETVAALERSLAQAREETKQLEEENAEQLQALEDLDRQLGLAKAELRLVNKHAEELGGLLETERKRAADEHRQITAEMRELRRLMERQGDLLEQIAGAPYDAAVGGIPAASATASDTDDETLEVGGRTAELLRRATSRRAHRRPS